MHRALDTVGALLGPLIAFGLLAIAPLAFDTLFLVSFCFAIAGLGVIVLLVREPKRAAPAPDAEPVRLRAAFALLREAAVPRRCSSPRACSPWRRPATASST